MHNLPLRPLVRVSTNTIQLLGMESQRGLRPRLSRFDCNIDWVNPLLRPALSLLTHRCRCLQTLKLDVNTSCALSSGEIGRPISASRNTLHYIDIQPLTPPEIFPVKSDLPQLWCLDVLQKPRFPNQIPPENLSCLETANLSGSHGSNVQTLARFWGESAGKS